MKIKKIKPSEALDLLKDDIKVYVLRELTIVDPIYVLQEPLFIEETDEELIKEIDQKLLNAGSLKGSDLKHFNEINQIKDAVIETEMKKLQAKPEPGGEEQPKKKKATGPIIDKGKIINLYRLGRSPKWIAQEMNCSPQTVYNTIKDFEAKILPEDGKK